MLARFLCCSSGLTHDNNKTVPPKSDVIFLFGEIDCREGLIISVEKCRYQDLQEAAQALHTSPSPQMPKCSTFLRLSSTILISPCVCL